MSSTCGTTSLWANFTKDPTRSGMPPDWSILTGFVNTRGLLTQIRNGMWLWSVKSGADGPTRFLLLSRRTLEPLISLDLVGTKFYCFRTRLYCYYCLYNIFSANHNNTVRRSEELRGGPISVDLLSISVLARFVEGVSPVGDLTLVCSFGAFSNFLFTISENYFLTHLLQT